MRTIGVLSIIPNILKELRRILPNLNFQEIKSVKDDALKSSEIVIADPSLIAPIMYDLPSMKWLQSTWAGVDAFLQYFDPQKPLPFLFTRYTGEHFGKIMGEYVVTAVVNHERDMYKIFVNQKQKVWGKGEKIENYRIIADLTIGILGIGNIGIRVGKLLSILGAKVVGYGRRENFEKTPENEYLSKYYTKNTLHEFLKECDYVVNVLPSTPDTIGLLNGTILENCKDKESVFINIGRGSIIDENDLVESLNKKWLSAAILDVFPIEPLPESSPLWTMPQVTITPHCSGMSRGKDIAEQFAASYKLYLENKPIPGTLNIQTGY